MTQHFQTALAGQSKIIVKNALFVMDKIYKMFPRTSEIGQQLLASLNVIANDEKRKGEDVQVSVSIPIGFDVDVVVTVGKRLR